MTATMTPPLFTVPDGASRAKRLFVYSALARIVIFILLTVAVVAPLHWLVTLLGWGNPGGKLLQPEVVAGVVLQQLVPALVAYLLLVRFVERRRPVELAHPRAGRDIAVGLVIGFLYISSAIAVLALLGAYTDSGFNSDVHWLGTLMVAGIGAGVMEELMFRGVLFRIVEEGLGTWAALAVSALFFGGVHMGNPGATVWSSVAIAIEAGLLLGMIYHVTRSLPLCMGVHAAWNFTLAKVYGGAVSGHETSSGWLASKFDGPDLLTGGAFGIEASLVAVVIGGAMALALAVYAVKRGTIVPWRGHRDVAPMPLATGHPPMAA